MVLWRRFPVHPAAPQLRRNDPITPEGAAITGLPRDRESLVAKPAAYHPTSQFLPDNANNIGHPLCGNRQSGILIKVNYFFHYLADPRSDRTEEEEGLIARIGTLPNRNESSSIVQDSEGGFYLDYDRTDGGRVIEVESNVSRHVLLHVCRRTIDKRDREGKINGTLRERERERISKEDRRKRLYLIFVGFVLRFATYSSEGSTARLAINQNFNR